VHFGVKNSSGFILVVVMLFLSILSLLALSVLEVNLLENKTSVFYYDQVKSFYMAEESLLQKEQQIFAGQDTSGVAIDEMCGVTIYLLTATASYRSAKTILCSTVAKVDDSKNCNPKPNIASGRQAFWSER
jgi:Tfp pilus assembly protein PilX